jgi:hypothetical protein
MLRQAFVFLFLLLSPVAALADARPDLCHAAIEAAERAHGIPNRLLSAIAHVESGRRDETTGRVIPWPWTINMDGQGRFYEAKAQAVAAATSMRPHVVHSIDVGCMQISLTHHPDAFPDLETAFDPLANADYGARFLRDLFAKTQSWPKAVALYHSATPELGNPYQAKVYAAWPEELQVGGSRPLLAGLSPFGQGWKQQPTTAPATGPRIIPLASGAFGPAPGKTLDAYRATPIRLATRLP